MKRSLQEALDNVDMTYSQLADIANDIINPYVADIDATIKTVTQIERLSNDDIRGFLVKLSTQAFQFAEIKEKSAIKAECAEALRKESYAVEFNQSEGSVANRESTATINTSGEILAETVHDLISNLFKTKLDEVHRIVDTLKTVLMSRMQEAKLTTGVFSE